MPREGGWWGYNDDTFWSFQISNNFVDIEIKNDLRLTTSHSIQNVRTAVFDRINNLFQKPY